LNALKLAATEIFRQENFTVVPHDWFVVLADIQNSTSAVEAGQHNEVNLIAAGSIIAGLNVARLRGVEVPYFFGGDGGLLLIPRELMGEVLAALYEHASNTYKNFGLSMHVGSLATRDIIDAGRWIQIAKLQLPGGLRKAIVIGDGFAYAEEQIKIKSPERENSTGISGLNLDGLECRWDRVKPPPQYHENVCCIVQCLTSNSQLEVYNYIMQAIERIYGDPTQRSPLSTEQLHLDLSSMKVKREMLVKFGVWKVGYFLSTWMKNILGPYFFRKNLEFEGIHAQEYLRQVISNADTLTIDGKINTIISGDERKRKELLGILDAEEKAGRIVYGHHISRESIMTCYIENRDSKHVHFVDGSDGGYTEAAKELKSKLKARYSDLMRQI
jgi:hypothetical protein